jgi:hypothetical protein
MSFISNYEDRLCAFVDILGFRELIRKSERQPQLAYEIRKILADVVNATPVWERDNPTAIIASHIQQTGASAEDASMQAQNLVQEYSKNERGIAFSDSLILSAAADDPRPIQSLIISLLYLSRTLAVSGHYVRGGISLGLLCHESNLCFGPSLISAYDLEQNLAKSPRIIVDEKVNALLQRLDSFARGPLTCYLKEDTDGIMFLHFLGDSSLRLLEEFRFEHMREIRKQLKRQLTSQTKEMSIKSKLQWLARYFNDALEQAPMKGIAKLDFNSD